MTNYYNYDMKTQRVGFSSTLNSATVDNSSKPYIDFTTENETQDKKTNELKKVISNIKTKYNFLKPYQIKELLESFLNALEDSDSGKNINDYSKEELEKAQNNVIEVIKHVKNANYEEIQAETNCIAAIIKMGYDSAESFYKKNRKGRDEDIVERIKRCDADKNRKEFLVKFRNFLGSESLFGFYNIENGVDISKLDKEEQKEYINKYLNEIIIEPKKKKGISDEEIIDFVRTEIAKLIYNSKKNGVDKNVLLSLFASVQNELKADAVDTYINSTENPNETADDLTLEDIYDILENPDCEGKTATDGEKLDVQSVVTRNQSAEGQDKSEKELFEAVEKIEQIKKKIKNNGFSSLTEEEKDFYNKYKSLHQHMPSITAGMSIGALESKTSVNHKKLFITNLSSNTQEYDTEIYRRSFELINEHYQSEDLPAETLNNIETILNEATNNNYSIIQQDIQNGTRTELNPPIQSVNSNNTSVADNNVAAETIVQNSVASSEVTAQNTASASVNTVNTTSTNENTSVEIVPEDTVQVAQAQVNNSVSTDNKETKTSQENAPAPAKSFEAVAKSGIEAVKEYAKNNNLGAVKTALLILNTKTNSTSVMAFAINTFKAMSISVQRLAFEGIHNSSASKTIIDKALDSRLLCEIKGKNIWETEMIENRKEELKKQNPDACKSIFNSEVA